MRKIHKFCWHLVRIFGQKLKLILNIFRSTGMGASGSKVGCWTCFLQNIQGKLFQEKWKESGFMAVKAHGVSWFLVSPFLSSLFQHECICTIFALNPISLACFWSHLCHTDYMNAALKLSEMEISWCIMRDIFLFVSDENNMILWLIW